MSVGHESLTPKRVRFAIDNNKENDSRENNRKATSRSFVEMISPFKKRNDRSPTPEPKGSVAEARNKTIKSGKEHYSRKNLNDSVKTLKDTIQNFIETGKNMKEKAHSIFV